MRSFYAISAALVLSVVTNCLAQAPDALSFQGHLTKNGALLDSTGVSITFKLYKGATSVWTETQSVDVADGVFDVFLGKITPMDTVAFNRPIELGIKLDGTASEMSPRTPLASAAYARALPGLYTFIRDYGGDHAYNVVGGSPDNVVGPSVVGATLFGGGNFAYSNAPNRVNGPFGTVSGGWDNSTSSQFSTVGGGYNNEASGLQTTVAGGVNNIASGARAIVGGGFGNEANGRFSMVLGGLYNVTQGGFSLAAGQAAQAIHSGTFVWADSASALGTPFASSADNQFLVRAGGGVGINTNAPLTTLTIRGADTDTTGPTIGLSGNAVNQFESGRIRFMENASTGQFRGMFIQYDGSNNRLHIGDHPSADKSNASDVNALTVERSTLHVGIQRDDPTYPLHVGTSSANGNGAHVTAAGTWTNGSSRAFKTDFQRLDTNELLETLVALPVTRWRYKGEEDVTHIGPVAEDFRAAFGLGHDERYITTVDADGVALAAIQGLYQLVRELQVENERMRAAMTRAGLE